MSAEAYKFSRKERLKSLKTISKLFVDGKVLYNFPLKLVWSLEIGESGFNKFAVSVPKRRFKTAVSRNLLKRRIRETYRLNKKSICMPNSKACINIMFIFLGKESLNFSVLEASMKILIAKLNVELTSSEVEMENL